MWRLSCAGVASAVSPFAARIAARNASSSAASTSYDAIVVGLGAHGSAALYHLARSGRRVLGIERWAPGHANGSSHGFSRITRLAYFEGSAYVPLLKRSLGLFKDLQSNANTELQPAARAALQALTVGPDNRVGSSAASSSSGTAGRAAGGGSSNGNRPGAGAGSFLELYRKTGIIDAGGEGFAGAVASARQYGLEHEVLSGKEVNTRFPGYNLPETMPALFQPDGGMLNPEACVAAHTALAMQHGAEARFGEAVASWSADKGGSGVTVTTDAGTYTAERLVLCAGAWMPKLVPQLAPVCVPQRQTVAWFEIRKPSLFQPEAFPVFILTDNSAGAHVEDGPSNILSTGSRHYYGFPEYGRPGLKFGIYDHTRPTADPDHLDRKFHDSDAEALYEPLRRFFPAADGKLMHGSVCMFTNTPDGHFILDRHPRSPQVILSSACSGHGFKLSAVVGELLAGMVDSDGQAALPGVPAESIAMHRMSAQRPGFDVALTAFAAAG